MRDGTKTKATIARVALDLFVTKGVTETTTKDIARMAGVAEGAMYRHYASKEALAWDLFVTPFTHFAGELDRLQHGQRTLRAKLDVMIRQFCAFFDQDRTLFTYLLLDQHGHLARVKPDTPNPVDVLRRVIAGGMARREIPKGDADVATAMVLGLVLQVAITAIYGRITRPLTSLADTLVAAAWRVLKP